MFASIEGDEDTIMGLPIKKIKYLDHYNEKYLVIGNPISHSLSPRLHNYWLKQNNIDAIYDKKALEEDGIKEIIHDKERKNCWLGEAVPFKKSNSFVRLTKFEAKKRSR